MRSWVDMIYKTLLKSSLQLRIAIPLMSSRCQKSSRIANLWLRSNNSRHSWVNCLATTLCSENLTVTKVIFIFIPITNFVAIIILLIRPTNILLIFCNACLTRGVCGHEAGSGREGGLGKASQCNVAVPAVWPPGREGLQQERGPTDALLLHLPALPHSLPGDITLLFCRVLWLSHCFCTWSFSLQQSCLSKYHKLLTAILTGKLLQVPLWTDWSYIHWWILV